MIVALPLFGDEVSPRFDCARKFFLARVEGGEVRELNFIGMEESNPIKRARNLGDRKVNKIICDGIDDFSSRLLQGLGIQVIPWVSGNARKALDEFIKEYYPSSIGKNPMEQKSYSPTGAVMVVGGGIAGIQSALDLAQSGFYVYLVEKSPGIGGIMPQLDKTFPTNECSM